MSSCRATNAKHKEREALADAINAFLRMPQWRNHVFDVEVTLSSDEEFHCLTVTLIGRKDSRADGAIQHGGTLYHGVRIASATQPRERESLGDTLTNMGLPDGTRVIVRQSSDSAFHCLVYVALVP